MKHVLKAEAFVLVHELSAHKWKETIANRFLIELGHRKVEKMQTFIRQDFLKLIEGIRYQRFCYSEKLLRTFVRSVEFRDLTQCAGLGDQW
jgi:hypothetical protein